MVNKVGCPGYKQLRPFTFGVYQEGYYYLIDNINEKLVKVQVEEDNDAVIMVCNSDNQYLFYDENMELVNVEHSVKGSVDLPDTINPYFPTQKGGHHICIAQTLTDYYIIVTGFQIAGTNKIGLQLFNMDLEVINEHIIEYANAVAYNDNNRVIVMVASGGGSTISIYEIDHEPTIDHNSHPTDSKLNILVADGIFGWDKRECLYLDGYLWIVDNHYRMLEKRATNVLRPPLPTSLHNIALSIEESGGEQSRLYNYKGNILAVNKISASWANCKFNLFNSITGALIKRVSFDYNPPRVITTMGDYIYFIKPNGDLCQMNSNLEIVNTVSPNFIGLVALQ